MTDILKTMIVPASLAPLARALAAGLSSGGAGMFTTGLSPTGTAPATHYVSSGFIAPQFDGVMQDGSALFAACQAAAAAVTLAQCNALVTQSDVSDDPPFVAMARLGLQLVQSPE